MILTELLARVRHGEKDAFQVAAGGRLDVHDGIDVALGEADDVLDLAVGNDVQLAVGVADLGEANATCSRCRTRHRSPRNRPPGIDSRTG